MRKHKIDRTQIETLDEICATTSPTMNPINDAVDLVNLGCVLSEKLENLNGLLESLDSAFDD